MLRTVVAAGTVRASSLEDGQAPRDSALFPIRARLPCGTSRAEPEPGRKRRDAIIPPEPPRASLPGKRTSWMVWKEQYCPTASRTSSNERQSGRIAMVSPFFRKWPSRAACDWELQSAFHFPPQNPSLGPLPQILRLLFLIKCTPPARRQCHFIFRQGDLALAVACGWLWVDSRMSQSKNHSYSNLGNPDWQSSLATRAPRKTPKFINYHCKEMKNLFGWFCCFY